VLSRVTPIRMIVPGWEGPFSVKYLRHIKVGGPGPTTPGMKP